MTTKTKCGAVSEHGDVCGLPPHDRGLCQSDGPRKHVSSPEKEGKPWRWYRDDALDSNDATAWNAVYPVGTPVLAWPGTRDEEPLTTRTRTPAWTLGHGAAVVSVEGRSGGIALTHIQVIEPSGDTPMTTTDTTARCWVLINATGTEATNGDYAPHYPDEQAALNAKPSIEEYGEAIPPLTVRQLDQACTIVDCSCCGEEYDEFGDGYTVHFAQGEAALVTEADWTDNGDGTYRCIDCGPNGDCTDCITWRANVPNGATT